MAAELGRTRKARDGMLDSGESCAPIDDRVLAPVAVAALRSFSDTWGQR